MKELLIKQWPEIMEYLKDEFNIHPISYSTWLSELKCSDVVDNTVYIINEKDPAGNNIDYLNERYYAKIKTAIQEITETAYEIKLIPADNSASVATNQVSKKVPSNISGINLVPEYTFDNFIVSSKNQIVYAAALKVAEAPGQYYNPLYIYGDPGLGKTHLMNSIAHFISEQYPDMKIMYVTSEAFMNELVQSIRYGEAGSMESFREKYRNVDVLLIDDIQFIIGKDSTQTEFFNTFNYLYNLKKQIVISSDKPPRDFNNLEERLKSRFQCGLEVDITAPDFETKMAILKKKHEMKQLEGGYTIKIDEEVFTYIAENIDSSVRALEGALNKILAMARLQHIPVTLEMAENALRDIIFPNNKNVITPEFIVDIVAEHFSISVTEIMSPKRDRKLVIPRQISMYLSRKYTELPLTDIAERLDRNHATVLHGIETITKKIETDDNLANTIEILTKKLNIK